MVITSHMSDASKAAAMLSRNPHWLLALLPAMLLVIPATAWGDIYKWTDEQGRTYYSDSLRRPPGRQRTSLWWRRKSNPRLRSRHCLPGLKLWSVSNKLSNIRCRHLQLRRRLPTPAITRQHRFRRLHLRLRVITIADTTADTTVGITAAGTIPATRYITIRSPLHTRSIPRRPTGRGQHSLLRMAGSRAAAVDMSAVEFVAVVATRVTGDRRTIWGSIWIHVSCSAH